MAGPGFSTVPYPGLPPMPPPVDYPETRRRVPRWVLPVSIATLLIGLAVLIGLTSHNTGSLAGPPSEASVQQAIQSYLDAMASGDAQVAARNAGCGTFDQVRQQDSDLALAHLLSETFVKDYGKATVTSIDKIVQLSQYQLNVLFTTRTQKGAGTPQGGSATPQGQAQLLLQDGQYYVCSYYLRVPNVS